MELPTFTDRSSLIAQGLSRQQIDRAVRQEDLVAAHRGILVPRGHTDDLDNRCRAALSTQRDDGLVFGRTAAALLELPACPSQWGVPPLPIWLGAARDDLTRSRRAGIERHLRLIPEESVTAIRGIRVTTAARTLLDLAYDEPEVLVVRMLDAAFHGKRCTQEELDATLRQFVGLRHVRRQRRLVSLARPGVDSPRETEVRLIVVHAGLPMPQPRLEIWERGRLIARADLGYWMWLIWIEYDGFDSHSDRSVFGSDRFRDRWLARRGWEVFRLSNDDVRRPRAFLEQLATAIQEAPVRIAALPPSRSPEVAQARLMLGIDQPKAPDLPRS